jgi:hypothetical protein
MNGLAQALAPCWLNAQAAMAAFDAQVANPGPLPAGNACGNKRHTGTGRSSVQGDTSAGAGVENAPEALISAPADLRGFVQAQTVTEVARVLGMSRKTAWRLRKDLWPRDMRSVLQAWDAHKGLSTQQQSGWFLRRVHVGGIVLHVDRQWTCAALPARAGQTLAVARVDAQTLLVQTLDLPTERLTLTAKA